MPRNNETGPRGKGPGIGRERGFCARVMEPGTPVAGRGCGMGSSRGCGGGRGRRNMFHATGLPGWARGNMPVTSAPAQELAVLRQQAEQYGNALENIRQRIQEIETQPAAK